MAGDGHHFRVVQLPYNLAMTEAFTVANQRVGRETVESMQAAQRLGIYVMTSASIFQGKLARNLPPIIGELLAGLGRMPSGRSSSCDPRPGSAPRSCGMRSVAHVEENAGLGAVPPVPSARSSSPRPEARKPLKIRAPSASVIVVTTPW